MSVELKGLPDNVIPFDPDEREKFYKDLHQATKEAFNIDNTVVKEDTEWLLEHITYGTGTKWHLEHILGWQMIDNVMKTVETPELNIEIILYCMYVLSESIRDGWNVPALTMDIPRRMIKDIERHIPDKDQFKWLGMDIRIVDTDECYIYSKETAIQLTCKS